ncbi:MAG TPA: S1-like domain-containing RNA-binding protein [Flavipsychrobacter sp.]|nr:S1-like domain-containing RNA-binding protein [Flavipsychrobacter sp.]
MVQVGRYNTLRVVKVVEFGMYLDGGEDEILLPKRFVPADLKEEDDVEVFIYHDSENRLIATTQHPRGIVGDIVNLKVVSTTKQGAFLDWGLMKDLFVPLSQQVSRMIEGQSYFVYIYIDEQTGRVAATEKIAPYLSNEHLTIKEREPVDLLIYRQTEIGYQVIINHKYNGLLHSNEVFRDIEIGETSKGFIKTIRPDNKIDVSLGIMGYKRVEDESTKILRLLQENDGYLPYHDKSDPEEIYSFFGMSKKTFKMTIGALYKQHKVTLTQSGIKLAED